MGMSWNTSIYTQRQIDSVSYVSLLPLWITHSLPSQLSDTANGMEDLHSRGIIHGNLKPVSEPQDAFPNPLTTSGEHTY